MRISTTSATPYPQRWAFARRNDAPIRYQKTMRDGHAALEQLLQLADQALQAFIDKHTGVTESRHAMVRTNIESGQGEQRSDEPMRGMHHGAYPGKLAALEAKLCDMQPRAVEHERPPVWHAAAGQTSQARRHMDRSIPAGHGGGDVPGNGGATSVDAAGPPPADVRQVHRCFRRAIGRVKACRRSGEAIAWHTFCRDHIARLWDPERHTAPSRELCFGRHTSEAN